MGDEAGKKSHRFHHKYKSHKGADKAEDVKDTEMLKNEKKIKTKDPKMKETDDQLKELAKSLSGSSDDAADKEIKKKLDDKIEGTDLSGENKDIDNKMEEEIEDKELEREIDD